MCTSTLRTSVIETRKIPIPNSGFYSIHPKHVTSNPHVAYRVSQTFPFQPRSPQTPPLSCPFLIAFSSRSPPVHSAMSHLIIPTPVAHRQPFETITLRPRPLPRAQARPAIEAHGVSFNGSLTFVQLTAEQQPHGRPGGCGVDDGVPEAHQGKDDAGGVGKREGDEGWVDERVDSVYRGGNLRFL